MITLNLYGTPEKKGIEHRNIQIIFQNISAVEGLGSNSILFFRLLIEMQVKHQRCTICYTEAVQGFCEHDSPHLSNTGKLDIYKEEAKTRAMTWAILEMMSILCRIHELHRLHFWDAGILWCDVQQMFLSKMRKYLHKFWISTVYIINSTAIPQARLCLHLTLDASVRFTL